MVDSSWIGYVTAIGSIATPIIVLALTVVGWRFRRRFERQLELEDKLREDRIDTYNHVLEPFIILFTSDAAWEQDKKHKGQDKNAIAMKKMLSLEYRKHAFKMSLVGSDSVVRSYNDLFQHFYAQGENPDTSEAALKLMMNLLGSFLLAIRQSMGNEATALNQWEMLEWFITDARRWNNA